MKYKITLINVGRNKVNRVIETKKEFGITEAELRALKECEKCVMSSETELVQSDDVPSEYDFVVGSFRVVGRVKIEEVIL